jgi:hypothetical protein
MEGGMALYGVRLSQRVREEAVVYVDAGGPEEASERAQVLGNFGDINWEFAEAPGSVVVVWVSEVNLEDRGP